MDDPWHDEVDTVLDRLERTSTVSRSSRRSAERDLSKAAMARRMGRSRSSLKRLLDPGVLSVTLLISRRQRGCSASGFGSRWSRPTPDGRGYRSASREIVDPEIPGGS